MKMIAEKEADYNSELKATKLKKEMILYKIFGSSCFISDKIYELKSF